MVNSIEQLSSSLRESEQVSVETLQALGRDRVISNMPSTLRCLLNDR